MSKTLIRLNKGLSGILNSQRTIEPSRRQLTTKRLALLQEASKAVVTNPHLDSRFKADAWAKNAEWLVSRGLLRHHESGGYEITEQGSRLWSAL